jgi:hypothetical protein
MATRTAHTSQDGTVCEIVVLADHETVQNQCDKNDAAVKKGDDGLWYVVFVGEDGGLHGWDSGYETAEDAVNDIKQNA